MYANPVGLVNIAWRACDGRFIRSLHLPPAALSLAGLRLRSHGKDRGNCGRRPVSSMTH
jgi:hypothetical protein